MREIILQSYEYCSICNRIIPMTTPVIRVLGTLICARCKTKIDNYMEFYMREGERAGKVKTEWRKNDVLVLSIAGSEFQQPGIPDCWVCSGTYVGWVEWKNPTTVIRPIQKEILKKIKKYENAFVVRFTDDDHWEIQTELGETVKELDLTKVPFKNRCERLLQELGNLSPFKRIIV